MKTTTTTTDGTIADFLKAEASMLAKTRQRIGGYTGVADFLNRHGRSYTPKPLPSEIRQGIARECFKNCADLATRYQRFTYCEGYAAGIIPVLHAWVLDSDGKVIDPTWTGRNGRPEGWQYFGVAIKTRYVISHLCATETHGPVLDDWQNRWPIFTAPIDEWKAV